MKGLFRGSVAAIPRAFVASTAQLTSFHYAKEWLKKYEYLEDRQLLKCFLASMIGGVSISVMVTPLDLILTRLYNQREFRVIISKYRNILIILICSR